MSDDVKALETLEKEMKGLESIIIDGLAKQDKGVDGIKGSVKAIQDSIDRATEQYEKLEVEKKALEDRIAELEVKFKKPDFGGAGGNEAKMATPGQQFVLSDEYQSARDRKSKSTEMASIGSLFERKQIDGATRGDLDADRAPVWSERVPEIFFDPAQRQLRIMDIMNVSPTTSNNIEYFIETDYNPDGAESQTVETATKHQNEMNFELENAPVRTIADWIPVSRQVMDDAPQLQSYIDGRLTYAVMNEAERQILFGDGLNGELTGIMNTAGINIIGNPAAGDTDIDHIRKAIALVAASNYGCTGIILNPADWAAIELVKGTDGHYVWVTVPAGGEMRLWRVPVIETNVMEEGLFLAGAFGLGAQVWDRQSATIRISDSHRDYFVRNALAVLAEVRLALTVYRPLSFVRGRISTWESS